MAKNMVCATCDSTEVKRDAWAEWNVETQEWQLAGEPFDAAVCENCGGECRIDEIDIVDPATEKVQSALRAIVAHINGVLDDPDLVTFGSLLPDTQADCLAIATAALPKPA